MGQVSSTLTLPRDANNISIQDFPGAFTMTDASTVPQESPIGSGTSEVALVWPSGAIRLQVYAPSNAVTLRKVAGGASGGVFTIPVTTVFSIAGKPGDTTYIARGSATALDFKFDLLTA